MFPSKLNIIYFLSFICKLTADYAPNNHERWRPVPRQGVNVTCDGNLRITPLTKPVPVTQDLYYDEDVGSLYYTDERGPTCSIHRYEIDTKKDYSADLASYGCERCLSPFPIKDTPNRYFVCCNDDVAIVTWDGKSSNVSAFWNISKLEPAYKWSPYILKSGLVAPSGALLIYSNPNALDLPDGNSELLALINGKPKKVIKGFKFGVGLGFSRDGRSLYFGDLTAKYLYEGRYNPKTDTVENARILTNFSNIPLGFPDVLTIDEEGFIWIACSRAAKVAKIDPYTGNVICTITFSADHISGVIFGRCPEAEKGTRGCLYVPSTIDLSGKSDGGPSAGTVFLVEGIKSNGVPPLELRLKTVIGTDSKLRKFITGNA